MNENLVNEDLVKYIQNNIFEVYKLNGKSHGIEHIKYVIGRCFELSQQFDNIDYNILYTTAAYHDIGDHIDRKTHEIISANWMMNDENLDKFFSVEQKKIIKEAIEDHRSSSGKVPRNLYGKILASADKNISVEEYFKRACEFGLEHYKDFTIEQQIERVYDHAVEKFGKNGYAVNQFFVEDDKYEKYLKDLQELIDNKEEFVRIARETFNNIIKE